METVEQYKKRQVLAKLKQAQTLVHSSLLEANALMLTSAEDIKTAEDSLQAGIDALVAELTEVEEV